LKIISKQNSLQDNSLDESVQSKGHKKDAFPELVRDLPARATITIIRMGNLKMTNNWMVIAAEIWLDYSLLQIRIEFEEGKMQAILEKWGSEGATTSQLFQILIKVGRKDILIYLQKDYPFVR
jgi:hypothetical protein